MKPVTAFLDQRILDRLRGEYLEMPGLKLTGAQMQRLCGIDESMCTLILDSLVKTNFLCRKPDGTYMRLTEGALSLPRPIKAAVRSHSFMTTRRAS